MRDLFYKLVQATRADISTGIGEVTRFIDDCSVIQMLDSCLNVSRGDPLYESSNQLDIVIRHGRSPFIRELAARNKSTSPLEPMVSPTSSHPRSPMPITKRAPPAIGTRAACALPVNEIERRPWAEAVDHGIRLATGLVARYK